MIGFLRFIFSLLLTLYLINGVMISLTSFENMKELVHETIIKKIEERINLEQFYKNLTEICHKIGPRYEVRLNFFEKITFLCRDIENKSYEEFIGLIMKNIYYKQYNCSVMECLSKGNFGIIFTKSFNDFLRKINFYLLILIAFILMVSIIPRRGLKEMGKSSIYISSTFLIATIALMYLKIGPEIIRKILLNKFDTYVYLLIAGLGIYFIGKLRERYKKE